MPQPERDSSGQPLKPIVGENREIGLKGEYFGGRFNTCAAISR